MLRTHTRWALLLGVLALAGCQDARLRSSGPSGLVVPTDAGVPPEICHEDLERCLDQGEPQPQEGCEELLGMCLSLGVSPETCHNTYDECLQVQDPCDHEPVDECFCDPAGNCYLPDGTPCGDTAAP